MVKIITLTVSIQFRINCVVAELSGSVSIAYAAREIKIRNSMI